MHVWVLKAVVNHQYHKIMLSLKHFFILLMRGEPRILGILVSAFCSFVNVMENRYVFNSVFS